MLLKLKKKINRLYYTFFGYGVDDIIDGTKRPPLSKCKPKERLQYVSEMRRMRALLKTIRYEIVYEEEK